MEKTVKRKDLKLWYEKPAEGWTQGLPMGNGRVGIMVYGDPKKERIDLSEVTCFSGERDETNNQPGAVEAFYEMREAQIQGDYEKSREWSNQFIGVRNNYGTNLPVGYMNLEFDHDGEVEDYKRELDLNTSISIVTYKKNNISYSQKAFVSNPDQIIAFQIKADQLKALSFELSLSGGDNPYDLSIDSSNDLLLKGQAYETKHSDGKTGVDFHGRARVILKGGHLTSQDSKLIVKEANEAIILIALKTSFDDTNPIKSCHHMINQAAEKSFKQLSEAHVEDYQKLFNRVELNLEQTTSDEEKPTDQRLQKVVNGEQDHELTALMFQYGRYLLIASSRENSPLPTPLQGVWNDNVAAQIGWTCDMHLDINTQMNYWPAGVTNLAECQLPLFKWIEEKLIPSGRITAKESYGLPGWVAELVSNAWGFSAPYWAKELSPCPTGGVWILSHLWEHYLFTKDKTFLKEKAYPQMREAVEFFTKYVFKDEANGFLTSGPSISPENSFLIGEKEYFASIGPTYEIILIRELFSSFNKASEILGIQDELVVETNTMIEQLLPFEIGNEGELKEWAHDYPARDSQHRHTSHLLSLYPFAQITPDKTPELAKAAKRSIALKLTPKETWEDTGWARSMLMLYSARLREPKECLNHIEEMQRQLTHTNLLVKHPPTRGAAAFGDVYELDGNTGLTACVAEMLLQSHQEEIHLLPTLPIQWQSGSVKGLCARGGFEVDIRWEQGRLLDTTIRASKDGFCTLRYEGSSYQLKMEAGCEYRVDSQLEKHNKL